MLIVCIQGVNLVKSILIKKLGLLLLLWSNVIHYILLLIGLRQPVVWFLPWCCWQKFRWIHVWLSEWSRLSVLSIMLWSNWRRVSFSWILNSPAVIAFFEFIIWSLAYFWVEVVLISLLLMMSRSSRILSHRVRRLLSHFVIHHLLHRILYIQSATLPHILKVQTIITCLILIFIKAVCKLFIHKMAELHYSFIFVHRCKSPKFKLFLYPDSKLHSTVLLNSLNQPWLLWTHKTKQFKHIVSNFCFFVKDKLK